MRYFEFATKIEHGPINATCPSEDKPALQEICRVDRHLAPSGLAQITSLRLIEWGPNSKLNYWSIWLEPFTPPEDSCDTAFMREIST